MGLITTPSPIIIQQGGERKIQPINNNLSGFQENHEQKHSGDIVFLLCEKRIISLKYKNSIFFYEDGLFHIPF